MRSAIALPRSTSWVATTRVRPSRCRTAGRAAADVSSSPENGSSTVQGGPGHRGPLDLPVGERVDERPHLMGELHARRGGLRPGRPHAVETGEEDQVLRHGEVRVEVGVVPQVAEPPTGRPGWGPVDEHLPRGRPQEARHHLEQRRLARAVVAEDDERLAGGDVEVDAREGPGGSEAPRELADRDHRGFAGGAGPSRAPASAPASPPRWEATRRSFSIARLDAYSSSGIPSASWASSSSGPRPGTSKPWSRRGSSPQVRPSPRCCPGWRPARTGSPAQPRSSAG